MMRKFTITVFTLFLSILSTVVHSDSAADRGADTYRQCAACHSLGTGTHLTGPSLACAVQRRRFPVGENPTRQSTLQPEAIGAVMEVTK